MAVSFSSNRRARRTRFTRLAYPTNDGIPLLRCTVRLYRSDGRLDDGELGEARVAVVGFQVDLAIAEPCERSSRVPGDRHLLGDRSGSGQREDQRLRGVVADVL